MAYFLEYKTARGQVDKKYQQMGYERARALIQYFSSAEVITFSDRTKLSEYLNAIYQVDNDIKQSKRKAIKLKKNNKLKP